MAQQTVGRYRVQRRISAGSHGVVYAAESGNGVQVAIKVARGGPAWRGLLGAEFASQAKVNHPRVPGVLDVGALEQRFDEHELGTPYLVSQWIEGVPLEQWIAMTSQPERARLAPAIARDLVGAVSALHQAGVLHRDICPGNVLIDGKGGATLIDLGLSAEEAGGEIRGTLGYLAPEALLGHSDVRSDLYSLGATLYAAAAGRAPFATAQTTSELVREILRGAPPALVGLPAGLADLISRLLSVVPEARPATAAAVRAALDAIDAASTEPCRETAPPGHALPIALAYEPALAQAASNLATPGAALLIHADPAAGAVAFADEVARRAQLAKLAAQQDPRIYREPWELASRDLVARSPLQGWQAVIDAALRADAPVLLVCNEPAAIPAVIAGLTAGTGPGVVIIVEAASIAMNGEVAVVELRPLGDPELAAVCEHELAVRPDPGWQAAVAARSGRWLVPLVALCRAAVATGSPLRTDPRTLSATDATDYARRCVRELSRAGRGAVASIAIAGGAMHWADAAARGIDSSAVGELVQSGLAVAPADVVVLPRASTSAALAELAPAEIETAAREALRAAPHGSIVQRAQAARWLPLDAITTELLLTAAEQHLAARNPTAAGELARRLLEAPAPHPRAGLIAARAAIAVGDYPACAAALTAAEAAGAERREVALARAASFQRRGDYTSSLGILTSLTEECRDDSVIGAHARALVGLGRYEEALAISARSDQGLNTAEAAGLAHYYRSEFGAAEKQFATLERSATVAQDQERLVKAWMLRAMVDQRRGLLAAASDLYRRAADLARTRGDLHSAAVAELNAGTTLTERGQAALALPALSAAARQLGAVGAPGQAAAAEYNRAAALLALCQFEAAAAAAERAAAIAVDATSRAFAHLATADVARRRQDLSTARTHYERAYAEARTGGGDELALAACLGSLEAGATGAAATVAGLVHTDDDRDRAQLAAARGFLTGAALPPPPLHELIACGERAHNSHRRDRAWRAWSLAVAVAARTGAQTFGIGERALALHDHVIADAGPPWDSSMLTDPDRACLVAARPTKESRDERGIAEATTLRRLLALSRRLGTEPDLNRLLTEVMDTAIELTAAERGFLLLLPALGAAGPLEVVVGRGFEQTDLSGNDPTPNPSRSIADWALTTGQPVITVDAGVDDRFATTASVASLRLRSVLAVPLRSRGALIGCLYVDHRLRGGAFDEQSASLLVELSEVAAVAISNARLSEELRRRSRDVEALNLRLAQELTDRDAELELVKGRLTAQRERLGHKYQSIIGASEPIVRVLAWVDRAAHSHLPVVIIGESGTGKELVARAIHEHSSRSAAPFVAINCGAVHESLLESELFGHVRGAFTGADRDRKGLFEVADGGTLLLDEIADMPVGMQTKLLRVLQERAVRKVGDHRTRAVDVRVIVASQHPLAELVGKGTFRDDLRFRLDVLAIALPPLRDRIGDLPLLTKHLVDALTGGKGRRVTRAAERALSQYSWPGNVRELQNALARAVALTDGAIGVDDLPAHIAHPPSPKATSALGADLSLRPAVDALERRYIEEAITRSRGNQAAAARLLGLSRFGLQKKLRRIAPLQAPPRQ